jgi:hypothetical protein
MSEHVCVSVSVCTRVTMSLFVQAYVDTPEMKVMMLRRAAAGREVYPSEVRCPDALLMSLDYLFQRVLDADKLGPDPRFTKSGGVPSLKSICYFLFDRTRAIRNEYSMQNYGARCRNDALVIEACDLTVLRRRLCVCVCVCV